MHANTLSRNAQRIAAFKKIHADFTDIMKHEKCRTCSCFYGDVLNGVYEKIKKFQQVESDHNLHEIKNDFEHWLRDADLLKAHG
jgi:hypothetical protein